MPQRQVDRIVVRIEDDIITSSEVQELAGLPGTAGSAGRSRRSNLLAELIEQWVVNGEATAAHFPEPADSEIDREVARIRDRFPTADRLTEARLNAALEWSPESVRRMVTRQLFLARYLDYKFRSAVQVDDAAVDKYYREQFVPGLVARNAKVPPEDEVREQIRELLVQQGINDRASSWIDETKSRLNIEVQPAGRRPRQRAGSHEREATDALVPAGAAGGGRPGLLVALLAVPLGFSGPAWPIAICGQCRESARSARRPAAAVGTGGLHTWIPWRLRVTLDEFTIHGREPASAPPFLAIERLEVSVRIDSFWRKKISVGDVEVERPQINVQIARDGSSNVPVPPGPRTGKPIRQRLFDVAVRKLRIDHGEMIFNDVRIPLVGPGRAVRPGGGLQRRCWGGECTWEISAGSRWCWRRGGIRTFPSDVGGALHARARRALDHPAAVAGATYQRGCADRHSQPGARDLRFPLSRETRTRGRAEHSAQAHGTFGAGGVHRQRALWRMGGWRSPAAIRRDRNHAAGHVVSHRGDEFARQLSSGPRPSGGAGVCMPGHGRHGDRAHDFAVPRHALPRGRACAEDGAGIGAGRGKQRELPGESTALEQFGRCAGGRQLGR